MSVALLVITDGRLEYLEQTILSAAEMLRGPITERWMYDDTGDRTHRAILRKRYPEFVHINAGDRQGFGGAIAAAWRYLREHSAARWIFHLEGDFTFNRPVPLEAMAGVLEAHPHLVQMALLRQPWNAAECAAGGIIPLSPEAYQQQEWLEHGFITNTVCFTTNPSLIPRRLIERGWPVRPHSEGHFGIDLFSSNRSLRSAFWGHGETWVEHIGLARVGHGY